MPTVKKVRLSDTTVFSRLSDAPVGTLLQIAADAVTPEVCIRAELNVANGTSLGVVFLEGDTPGVFVTDADLNYCPAIDVTNLAEVVLAEPTPKAPGVHQSVAGCIYRVSDRAGVFFFAMAVRLLQVNQIIGYLRLIDPLKGHIEQIADRIYLGTASVIDVRDFSRGNGQP